MIFHNLKILFFSSEYCFLKVWLLSVILGVAQPLLNQRQFCSQCSCSLSFLHNYQNMDVSPLSLPCVHRSVDICAGTFLDLALLAPLSTLCFFPFYSSPATSKYLAHKPLFSLKIMSPCMYENYTLRERKEG